MQDPFLKGGLIRRARACRTPGKQGQERYIAADHVCSGTTPARAPTSTRGVNILENWTCLAISSPRTRLKLGTMGVVLAIPLQDSQIPYASSVKQRSVSSDIHFSTREHMRYEEC